MSCSAELDGKIHKTKESEGKCNMCQAIRELMADSRKEGREEGREESFQVFRYLERNGRMEDIMLSIKDYDYYKALLQECEKNQS